MSDIRQAQTTLLARILEGSGEAPLTKRREPFNNIGLTGPLASLVGKVANRAYAVTPADFTAAKATGFTEDQLFELVVCTAVGQAMRQHQAALGALATVASKE